MVMTEIARIRIEELREEGFGVRPHRRRRTWRSTIGLRLVDVGWRIAGASPQAVSDRIEVRA